jgi:hypothetical protein
MHQNPSICQQNSHPFIRPDSVLMENLGLIGLSNRGE